MTPAEEVVYNRLIRAGCRVVNKGWPDLLVELNGRVIAVEVKYGPDTVRPHQSECHEMLRKAGIPVDVQYVTDRELSDERLRKRANPTQEEVSEAVNRAFEQVFDPKTIGQGTSDISLMESETAEQPGGECF